MFAKLGAKVVVIEFMENILQMLDVDLKVIWLTLRCHQRWLNDAKWGKGIPYKRRFKNLGR
jgi:pyruvate/2-oxoglutarate dehydrogenase complex dihydrolipoamide dehydrogenase (E3) component